MKALGAAILAFSQQQINALEVPKRGAYIRAIFIELEW